MKKTSQIALSASALFFLAAGMVKFWPEERFFPRPVLSSVSLNAQSPLRVLGPSAQVLPANQGLLPPWMQRDPLPRPGTSVPVNQVINAASPLSPNTLPGKKSILIPPVVWTNTAPSGTASPAPVKKTPDTKVVSLAAQNMPVGDVLAQVFHRAGVLFSLPGRLREPVNIIFVDAPLSQALDQTLSLTTKPHLTYHKEDGVYVVVADDSYNAPTPAPLAPPIGGGPAVGFRQGAF